MMIELSKITEALEEHFPLSSQEQWDNSGLQVGNPADMISGAVMALDLTDEVIEKAKETGANLIITHHPFIFKPISSVTEDNQKGRMIIRLIKEGINLYSLHTPADKGAGGLNDWIADKLHLLDPVRSEKDDFLVIGAMPKAMAPAEFASLLKGIFGLDQMEADFSFSDSIRIVAICSGSGMSCAEEAEELGADTMITGDVKWSHFTQWHERMNICNITHFHSEKQFAEITSCIIRKKFPKFALQTHNVNITKYW